MGDAAVRLVELAVAGDGAAWERAGFAVTGDLVVVGRTTVRLGAEGEGLVGWTLEDATRPAPSTDLDGLPTTWTGAPQDLPQPGAHPNGATHLDHVVVMTPDLERTSEALAGAGLDLRRTREAGQGMRQRFYRLGEVILEVVGDVPADGEPDGPARFWGLVAVVPDVDALAAQLGPEIAGAPKDAVQPGRRIVTVRRGAGLGVALAFLTPRA